MSTETIDDQVLHHIPATHPTACELEQYRAAAHSVGLDETFHLLVVGRPGAAVRRLARTVEEELACIGLAGIRIPITEAMGRIAAGGHSRRAASRRLPHHGEADR